MSCLPVPITCVVDVPFASMQVGMHPGTVLAALVHDDPVRLLPIILACPPQRGEGRSKRGRRLALFQRGFEFGKRHGGGRALVIAPFGVCRLREIRSRSNTDETFQYSKQRVSL